MPTAQNGRNIEVTYKGAELYHGLSVIYILKRIWLFFIIMSSCNFVHFKIQLDMDA